MVLIGSGLEVHSACRAEARLEGSWSTSKVLLKHSCQRMVATWTEEMEVDIEAILEKWTRLSGRLDVEGDS